MRVLMTGHRGWVAKILRPAFEDVDVAGYDLKDGDDLFDAAKLTDRLTGCDVCVHLAAYPHRTSTDSWEKFHRLNTEGTVAVYEAVKATGVPRLVYCSTGNVYCLGDGLGNEANRPLDVDDTPDPDSEKTPWYPRSKLLAERYLRQQVGDGIVKVVLRPNWIDGSGGPAWRGASVTRTTLARAFRRACDYPFPEELTTYHVIEANPHYLSSLRLHAELLAS